MTRFHAHGPKITRTMSVIYVSEIEKLVFKGFRNDLLPHNCQHGGFSTCFLKDATFFIMSKLTTIRLICTSSSLFFENYILKKPVGLLHLILICLIIHSKKQSEHHYTPCHIIIMSVLYPSRALYLKNLSKCVSSDRWHTNL